MLYTTPDFQHPDTGIPCIFEWNEETKILSMQLCDYLVDSWNLEEEQPEALAETKDLCKKFGTRYCEGLEDANKIIMNTRYYDNGENVFYLD